MKKKTSAKMIKKAIDSYPGGICFSALDGRVILVNEKMNQLMLELTGHMILNAKAAWEELANFANDGKAKKLTQSWLPKDSNSGNGNIHRQLFFRFSDSSVWRFELRFLDSNTLRRRKLQNSTGSARNCTRTPSGCRRCKSGRKPCWTVSWKSI